MLLSQLVSIFSEIVARYFIVWFGDPGTNKMVFLLSLLCVSVYFLKSFCRAHYALDFAIAIIRHRNVHHQHHHLYYHNAGWLG